MLAIDRQLYVFMNWDLSNDMGFMNGAGNLVGGRRGGRSAEWAHHSQLVVVVVLLHGSPPYH
jgi:hypothetical protein